MSGTDYNYDVEGQFFPYFILTITGLITLPLTYSAFKPNKELENTAPRIRSEYKPRDVELIDEQKKLQRRRERKLKRMILSGLGWVLMSSMVYLIIVTARTIPKIWDPYDVLGVSMSASEKEIKRHYRKLSLTQHPDKVQIDAAKNQTVESVNEHWVEITKAFKALTDEEIRNNFLQYGHPDGKQSFSMGIALPTFLVADGYGKYTLIFYLGLLGIFLPYVVGKWWYGTQKVTKDGILVNSAATLVKEYDEDMTEGDVITSLSGGEEYETIIGADRSEVGLSKVETSILTEGELSHLAGGLTLADKQKLIELNDAGRRKVLSLLWAHLGRVDLGDDTLNKEKFGVAPIAWQLTDALAVITQAFSTTRPLCASLHVSQDLIQAIPPTGSPLLQLPFFSPKIVSAIEGPKARNHLTVGEYMSMPAAQRKKLTVGSGLLSEQQYQVAIKTALQLPAINLERVYFRVTGERFVTPNSLVQLVVKFRFVPPGATNLPPLKEEDFDEEEAAESSEEKERFAPPIAHAPYFARDHSPVYHIFLGEPKMGRIAVPPFTYSTFDKPILTADGEPTYNVQTLKMQFGAPPGPGNYTFAMHIINDSYVGFDIKEFITLTVEDGDKAEDMEDEGEISEPGEDTIAGQLKGLREAVHDDSDDSDTDGDVADDTSDTNTDTDDED
ncbi:hypothetical protein BT63DRAFT_436588 [Microthyrium microscopicum]|uniref:J domain-containing protein n=1 Tax=Microthyrium microscopicum TaxID=703497 RepID=A0A6A6UKA7_9PEZI|nr:hypothetical protein BT63DRAFT_436588 [Microthyrium microscopicum]